MHKKKIKLKKEKNNGITLIALIITIIVLIILAGITLNLILGDNGILGKTKEAKFKKKMSDISEQYDLVKAGILIDSQAETNINEIYAGELLKSIIVDEELEVEESSVQDIKKLVSKVGKEEENYVIIYEGELYYVSQSKIKNNENQKKWCEDIGIKIWDYESNTGIKVVNGNYELVNGVWVCTPVLNTGFIKTNTRYIIEENGNLVPGDWINKKPADNWYDYKNKKWANIYVESSGIESYYVWIPRYAYKISETEEERMDVLFIDVDNTYIDATDESQTKVPWEKLEAEGYQIPEAFTWGDKDNPEENIQLPGYWISKYQLSDLGENYTIDFSTAASSTSINIKDITVNATKEVKTYTYAVNGKIMYTSSNPDDYNITDLAKGDKAVNVTALDANGNIVGSMTKLYGTAEVNEPELTGFDPDTTFYVYWDEQGNEHNETPISMDAPDNWYDYGIRNWANIVTRNNGIESYYVWIPRYAYQLDTVSERTYVKFLKGTSTEVDAGYQIPEAFTWGDNEDPAKNKQLTGYWISKYQLSIEENTPRMDAEMAAGGSVIRIKDITGTLITDGLKYEYYLNGKKLYEGTNSKENYSFTNLTPNTTYTVNIIARNSATNAYVGAVTKKIKTIEANAPELTGFNENQTYYVSYNGNGEKVIGNKISGDAPKNWYDYSNRNWANIVITDGEVKDGKIEGGTYQNYFVWIPRYEYRILEDRENLSTENRRTEVSFIAGISEETTPGGWEIPEAFTWGDNEDPARNKQLTGYWISKYQLSDY